MEIVTSIRLIYNPIAGQRHGALLEKVIARLRAAGREIELAATRYAGEAERLAGEAARDGVCLLAVAGGDGTINEVMNGLAAANVKRLPAVGLIPCGTANVVAREIGLQIEADRIADTLLRGRPLPIYPGLANGRVFLFSAGAGFDAQAVSAVDPRLKRLIGAGAYLWSALGRIVAGAPDEFSVRLDGAVRQANSVVVAKGRHYAGGYVIAPKARLDGDRFEVCLFRFPTRAHMVLFGAALIAGGTERMGNADSVMARRVEISGPLGEPVQLDGDIRTTLPCTLTVAERPLTLMIPADRA
ncbi:MAG: YegS/Rv2252/BmrU family lipid kinase [Hyphomicrobiales bacterium]|nr:YegS/Rv2252/BmrU family lipid kinase [Hyphomicrobiales bacterium]